MLSHMIRSHRGSTRLRNCTNALNISHAAMGNVFSGPRRHVSAASAVEPAQPSLPPCVARIFDRTPVKDDRLIIPQNPQGGYSGDTPLLNPLVGTSTPPGVVTAEPDKVERQEKEGQLKPEFWRGIAPYKDVPAEDFLSWRWSTKVCQIS